MSGASVVVQVEDAEVRAALARLAARTRAMRPVFEQLGQVVATRADLSFRDQASPWGEPWAGLSAVTLGRRRQGAGSGPAAAILRDSGRLAGSIHVAASDQEARVGVAASDQEARVGSDDTGYAATQQFGRADNRMYNTATGRPAPIPARPFLPLRGGAVVLPAEDRDAMLAILRQALAAALP